MWLSSFLNKWQKSLSFYKFINHSFNKSFFIADFVLQTTQFNCLQWSALTSKYTGVHYGSTQFVESPGTGESRKNILVDRKLNISLNSAIHRNARAKLFTSCVLAAKTNNDSYLLIRVMPFAGGHILCFMKFGLNARIYEALFLNINWRDFIL